MRLKIEIEREREKKSSWCRKAKKIVHVGLLLIFFISVAKGAGAIEEENLKELKMGVKEYLAQDFPKNIPLHDDTDIYIDSDEEKPRNLFWLRRDGEESIIIDIKAHEGRPLDRIMRVLEMNRRLSMRSKCKKAHINILCEKGDMTRLYEAIMRFCRDLYGEIESLYIRFENKNGEQRGIITDLFSMMLNNYGTDASDFAFPKLQKLELANVDVLQTELQLDLFFRSKEGPGYLKPLILRFDKDRQSWKITSGDGDGEAQARLDQKMTEHKKQERIFRGENVFAEEFRAAINRMQTSQEN